jgi:DsbC/DsbD-like thiol-disulfide interchange protein
MARERVVPIGEGMFSRSAVSTARFGAVLALVVSLSASSFMAAFTAAFMTSPALAQSADASAWAASAKSRARLVSAGGLTDGAYRVGVEISLTGEALTYWRMPGDAGVPPTFDFAASQNVASAEVAYPAPERHDEGGAEAFGWRGAVIFPVLVTPKDARLPVTLDLQLNYAACEKICVPADGRLRLTLTPAQAASVHAADIATWQARAPVKLTDWSRRFTISAVSGTKKPAWRVVVANAPAGGDDLFAEGPEGWYFDTKRIDGGFKVVLAETPPGAAGPATARITYRAGALADAGAVEFETRLDAGRASP